MKPTKKELRIKLKLMKIALKYYIDMFSACKYGICEVICKCSHRINKEECEYLHDKYRNLTCFRTYIHVNSVQTLFPELLKYKPDNNKQYWWNKNNKKIRIKVMTELINYYKEQLK